LKADLESFDTAASVSDGLVQEGHLLRLTSPTMAMHHSRHSIITADRIIYHHMVITITAISGIAFLTPSSKLRSPFSYR
jgi:hypothetical protein